jgi:hypothetical protein
MNSFIDGERKSAAPTSGKTDTRWRAGFSTQKHRLVGWQINAISN